MDSITITIEGLMAERAEGLRNTLLRQTEGNQPVFEAQIAEIDLRIECFEAALREGADAEMVVLWAESVLHLKSERKSAIEGLEYCQRKASGQRRKLAAIERFLAGRGAA